MNPKSSPALKVALLVAVVFGIFALSEPCRILGSSRTLGSPRLLGSPPRGVPGG